MKLTLVILMMLGCFHVARGINLGPPARIGEFKYVVVIEVKTGLASYSYCTGGIIHEKFILTAAHCFTKNDKKNKDDTHSQKFEESTVTVYANVIGRNKLDRQKSAAIKKKGLHVYFVPKYFDNGMEADIAVLELDSAFSFHGGLLEKVHFGDSNRGDVVLAGYGVDKAGKNDHKLKSITMTTISNIRCQAPNSKPYMQKSPESFICAQAKEHPFTGCPGDSGAPLVLKQSEVSQDKNEPKILIGILSRGVSCKSNDPNLFVRVAHYEDFIDKAIQGHPVANKVVKHDLKR